MSGLTGHLVGVSLLAIAPDQSTYNCLTHRHREQSTYNCLNHRHREQAHSHRFMCQPTMSGLTGHLVGVSLLAIAPDLSTYNCLTHRHREQAHSHRFMCQPTMSGQTPDTL